MNKTILLHIFFLIPFFSIITEVSAVEISCTSVISDDEEKICGEDGYSSEYCTTYEKSSADFENACLPALGYLGNAQCSYTTEDHSGTYVYCSYNDSKGFAIKKCCPASFLSEGEEDIPIEEPNIICPHDGDLQKELEEEYDKGNLAAHLASIGCQMTTTETEASEEFGCSLNGEAIFCADSPPLSASASNKGCGSIDDKEEYDLCISCLYKDGKETGAIWTELGCIDPSPAGIITRVFQIAIGIMGGIGVLRFTQIALLYNEKDPQKIAEAPGMLFSLVSGLILLILGIIVLRFLGINVLGLPEGFLG